MQHRLITKRQYRSRSASLRSYHGSGTNQLLLLVFGLHGFAVNFIQSKNSRLSSTLPTMIKRPQQSVCDVLRDFFQPCPLDTRRALNQARDDLLYRFITEHDCTSCPADWPLHQLREFYRVMVPIIADSYCNDGAAERFPVIQK